MADDIEKLVERLLDEAANIDSRIEENPEAPRLDEDDVRAMRYSRDLHREAASTITSLQAELAVAREALADRDRDIAILCGDVNELLDATGESLDEEDSVVFGMIYSDLKHRLEARAVRARAQAGEAVA